jgi:hypothetical protein
VICACICKCKREADDNIVPTLCIGCRLCADIDRSAKPRHGLPYTPASIIKLDPIVPISDAQKDAALQNWVAENGF